MEVIKDTFTAPDGTLLTSRAGEIGAVWSVLNGREAREFVIHGNGVRRPTYAEDSGSAGGNAEAATSGLLPPRPYTISMNVTAGTTGNNYQFAVGVVGTGDDYVERLVEMAGYSSTSNIYIRGDGSLHSFAFVGGVDYQLVIDVTDDAVSLKVGGVAVASGMRNEHADTGRLGFAIFDNSDSLFRINEISVSIPDFAPFWTGFALTQETAP